MRGFFAALRMTAKNRQQQNRRRFPFDKLRGMTNKKDGRIGPLTCALGWDIAGPSALRANAGILRCAQDDGEEQATAKADADSPSTSSGE